MPPAASSGTSRPPGRDAMVVRTRVAPDVAGSRLDTFLRGWLPSVVAAPLTHSAIRRMVIAGAVTRNGRRLVVPSAQLADGDRVDVRIVATAEPRRPDSLVVLFEDAWLIAVDKPAGLATVPSADPARPSLVRLVERFLTVRDGVTARLGVHQRLDRDTSGVVLFVKDAVANASIARQFERHTVEKAYRARAAARPGLRLPARIEAPLARSGAGRRSVTVVDPGGLAARTDVRVIGRRGGVLEIEARPRTGRRHQVRAHLASVGFPLLGDARYGGPASWEGRRYDTVQLEAVALRLVHPVTGQPLSIERRPR